MHNNVFWNSRAYSVNDSIKSITGNYGPKLHHENFHSISHLRYLSHHRFSPIHACMHYIHETAYLHGQLLG